LCRELGEKRVLGYCLLGLGLVALAQAETLPARQFMTESLKLREEMEDKLPLASNLVGLAGLAVTEGDPIRATQLIGVVEALLDSIKAKMEAEVHRVHERTIAAARSALGAEAYDAAYAEGQAMTLEQAIALASEN
jgi:hypothetical protein